MLTPVVPSAGAVDRASGPVVVVNDHVEVVPSGMPSVACTEESTEAV
jgi:hypothetical protein